MQSEDDAILALTHLMNALNKQMDKASPTRRELIFVPRCDIEGPLCILNRYLENGDADVCSIASAQADEIRRSA